MDPAVKKAVAVIALLVVGTWGMGVDAFTRVWIHYNYSQFEQGSPFHIASNYVMQHLIEDTPNDPNRNYAVEYPGSPKVYGKATCSLQIDKLECLDCLSDALDWRDTVYPAAMGVNVQYDVCTFRYEGYKF